MQAKVLVLISSLILSFSSANALTFKSGEKIPSNSQKNAPTSNGIYHDLWMPFSKTDLHQIDATKVKWKPAGDGFYDYLDANLYTPYAEVLSTWFDYQWSNQPDEFCFNQLITLEKQRNLREDVNEWIDTHTCAYTEITNFYRDRDTARLQRIYDSWASEPLSKFYTGNLNPPNWFDNNRLFMLVNAFSILATHYAYNRDKFDNTEKIDHWFTSWFMQNQNPNGRDRRKCPQNEPWKYTNGKVYKYSKDWDGDSCGTLTWRGANARLALGLATGNQELFISGVRMLEIQLAMFDEDGIFVEFASRAWSSPTYTTEIFHALHTAQATLLQAGVDLMEVKNPHGKAVHELLTGPTKWLMNPSLNRYLRHSRHGAAFWPHGWHPPQSKQEYEAYWHQTSATPEYLYFSMYRFVNNYSSSVPDPGPVVWTESWNLNNGRPLWHSYNPEHGLPAQYYLDYLDTKK